MRNTKYLPTWVLSSRPCTTTLRIPSALPSCPRRSRRESRISWTSSPRSSRSSSFRSSNPSCLPRCTAVSRRTARSRWKVTCPDGRTPTSPFKMGTQWRSARLRKSFSSLSSTWRLICWVHRLWMQALSYRLKIQWSDKIPAKIIAIRVPAKSNERSPNQWK